LGIAVSRSSDEDAVAISSRGVSTAAKKAVAKITAEARIA
jgi:hypothetical protein